MVKKYIDITNKVFDEVFKEDCYGFRCRNGEPNQIVVKVFGWDFFYYDTTKDACIVYDSRLKVQHILDYSDTYEEDLRQLLLDHVLPYNINAFEIQDELKMYYALKNKGLIEFIYSDVSKRPNTEIYYVWDTPYLIIECHDSNLVNIYGKRPVSKISFNYSDIDEVILYVEDITKFLTDNKEILDSYTKFDESIKQLVQEVKDDVYCKLHDGIEGFNKIYGRDKNNG